MIAEGASAFFTDVDRNSSPENPDSGKFIGIAESHGLRIRLPQNPRPRGLENRPSKLP